MEKLGQGLLIIARFVENGNLTGFLGVDTSGMLHTIPLEALQRVNSTGMFLNAEYDANFKTLVGTHGQSLASCPDINKDFVLQSRKNGISVLCNVVDTDTKEILGVVAYNGMGSRFNISYTKLNSLSSRNTCCNFDLKNNKDGSLVAVRKDGTPFEYVEMKGKKKQTQQSSGCIKQSNNEELPSIAVYNMDDLKADKFNVPCHNKLTMAILNVSRLTPYYYTILSAIKRKPAPIETMGVTEDTLYYSQKFVAEQDVETLTFVLIHEIMHIAMQHSIRFGKRTNHDLWNIACDLYINTSICRDFNVKYQGGITKAIVSNSKGQDVEIGIQAPDYGIFEETMNMKVDFQADLPESIYEKLLAENQNNQNSQQGSQGQSGQSGQNGQGNQQGSQGGQQGNQQGNQNQSGGSSGQQTQSDVGQDSTNQAGQLNNTSGQSQSGNNTSSQNQSGNQIGSNGSDEFDDNSGEGSDGKTQVKEVNITVNGKKLTVKLDKDVMSNNNSKSEEVQKENLDTSRKTLQRIKTKIEMEEADTGQSLVKNAGAGANLTQRFIEVGLSAGVDWRVLLKNLCKDKPKKTFTLAQPNQDYMNMGMTIASRRAIGKPQHISHVKFGIDVSGSVTKKELSAALSEINNIYKHFKVEGELIYWSTYVGDAGNFTSLKDMLQVKPITTGGTDVRCLFEYLAGETKVHGKVEADKPKEITAIFIITDGCFMHNFDDFARMFGKKVVWLITGKKGNMITFDPPFGRVLPLILED